MKALLLGATGATGKDLLEFLLQDPDFEEVSIFVRRAPEITHEKLRIHMIDFEKPEEWSTLVQGDILFSCLGTTLKIAGSKEAQWKVDYEYQYQFAKIAKENTVNSFILVSAANASSRSSIFYSKMKGQLEDAVRALHFLKLIIFNPPLLLRAETDRKMEIYGAKVLGFLNKLGMFRSQTPVSTKQLAKAMTVSSKKQGNGEYSFKGEDIRAILAQ